MGERKLKLRCVNFYPIENLQLPCEKDNLNGSKSAIEGREWRAKSCTISPSEVNNAFPGATHGHAVVQDDSLIRNKFPGIFLLYFPQTREVIP